MNHVEGYIGANFLTRTEGQVDGANPYPGEGSVAYQQQNWYFFPDGYLVLPLTEELNVGVGGFAQYGLGLKWQDPNTTYNGLFISQNAVIQSYDTNLVFSYRLFPQLSIAAGVVYRFSKVQLERNQGAIDPFTGAIVPVAHVKLNSDLLDNGGWGWNVGLMFKPVEAISIGAAYRSGINVDYDGEATFTSRPDRQRRSSTPLVAASLPTGNPPVTTSIDFPSSLNLGVGHPAAGRTSSSPSKRTGRSGRRSQSLAITFPTLVGRDILRPTNWSDTLGLSRRSREVLRGLGDPGRLLLRQHAAARLRRQPAAAGQRPQRLHRRVRLQHASAGASTSAPLWIAFKDRAILTPPQTDNYFGTYSETGLVLTAGIRIAL